MTGKLPFTGKAEYFNYSVTEFILAVDKEEADIIMNRLHPNSCENIVKGFVTLNDVL